MLPDLLVSAENRLDEAGAPAKEIEITPEMIEAGGVRGYFSVFLF